MQINRWSTAGARRSRTVAYAGTVWTVANAWDASLGFAQQVEQTFAALDAHLLEAGSARTHIISLQVMLADIGLRDAFDELWREWIGAAPEHWPQRACFQAALAPGLLVEVVAVAASAGASLHATVSMPAHRRGGE